MLLSDGFLKLCSEIGLIDYCYTNDQLIDMKRKFENIKCIFLKQVKKEPGTEVFFYEMVYIAINLFLINFRINIGDRFSWHLYINVGINIMFHLKHHFSVQF